jgi:hypothetical protein
VLGELGFLFVDQHSPSAPIFPFLAEQIDTLEKVLV